jgi:hypothetical protein
VNAALRNGDNRFSAYYAYGRQVRAALDSAFAKMTQQPPPVCTLFRGVRSWPGIVLRQGSRLRLPGYTSTSHVLARALMYASDLLMVVRVADATGWNCRWFYSHNEDEVVLDRGSVWRIVRVLKDMEIPERVTRHPAHPTEDIVAPAHVTVVELHPASHRC